jgi:hypothetical protein
MQTAGILPMRWDYNDRFGFPRFLQFYQPLVVWVMLIALPEAQTWCADNSRWPCNNVVCFRHKSKPVRPYLCVAIVVSRPASRECPGTANTLFLVYTECPMKSLPHGREVLVGLLWMQDVASTWVLSSFVKQNFSQNWRRMWIIE